MEQKATNQDDDRIHSTYSTKVTEETEVDDKSTVPDTPAEIEDKTVTFNQDNIADDDTGLDKLKSSDQAIKEDYVSHVFPFDDD